MVRPSRTAATTAGSTQTTAVHTRPTRAPRQRVLLLEVHPRWSGARDPQTAGCRPVRSVRHGPVSVITGFGGGCLPEGIRASMARAGGPGQPPLRAEHSTR
jgi:hypothetical protein